MVVVVGSFLTLFGLVFAVLWLAEATNSGNATKAAETAEKTFNTILPVLAGWVGTVLAFYFSSRSNERTSNSLDQVIRQTGGAPPAAAGPVSEKMIPFALIREAIDLKATPSNQIKLSDLKAKFTPSDGTAPITRLLFHEESVFRHVLHESTLNAFLDRQRTASPPPLTPPEAMTFADLLADTESFRQISKLVVFVASSAPLSDAKVKLEAVPGAQDIIVTATGAAGEPIIGWLTNNDLIKALPAS